MSNHGAPTRSPFHELSTWRSILFVGLLMVAALALRWPGLEKQVWNLDEGSTLTMAQIVRDGGVLYRDAADNRTPLVPYAKALILVFTGDWNARGVHLVLAGMLGLSAVWLWRIGRAGGDERTGIMAAGWFTLLSFVMLTVVDTMSAHTGWFLIFFSGLGMWAFLVACNRRSIWLATAAGTAFAFSALAKQPGLLDWGVCLVICLLALWTTPQQWRTHARLAAGLFVGLIWPLVATYAYFSAHGAWDDFLRYAWNYNTQLYVPEVPPVERLLGIRIPFILAWQHAPFALLLGGAGAVWLLTYVLPRFWRRERNLPVLPWLILGWSASGLASTILSGRDFAHYSIQVLPGLSLACAWVGIRLWERAREWRHSGRQFIHTMLLLGLLSLVGTALHRAATFDTRESLSQDIGNLIRAHTQPTERIFVWGYEPELHVFAQRLPSTRFVYAVFLTGLIPWTNIDPLKDTDYAIVPGSWADFWADFERSPPAMIVDTRGNRGFLKYPLRRQDRLWHTIEKEYVEVTEDTAATLGYALYRRVAQPAPGGPPTLAPSDRVKIRGPVRSTPGTTRIEVSAPPGTTAVTLYLNAQPYRRIESTATAPLRLNFFALGDDLPEGVHELQAVVEGADALLSPIWTLSIAADATDTPVVAGPAIIMPGREIHPIESEAFPGGPLVLWPETGHWQAHAPSKLVYPRPPELALLEFSMGFRPGAYDGSQAQKTDGVDVLVYFQNEAGQQTELYRRRLNPVGNAADRELITGRVLIPGMEPGLLTLLITPGPMNIAAFDWTYGQDLRGERSPMTVTFRGEQLPLTAYTADLGINTTDYAGRNVVFAHAPASFTFAQVPGMSELTGEFGLLDSAWQGPKKSAGAIFELQQVHADQSTTLLFSRTLLPATHPADRGVQNFQVPVPNSPQAMLRFITRPAHPSDNSFNHTFWHGLQARDFSTTIPWQQSRISSVASEAPNGFAIMDEAGQNVLFAHAPSRLVFPLPPGARQLKGNLGLIQRAYTAGGHTDGATFLVEVEDANGGHTLLYRRLLQPREIPEDRGAQSFTIDLPDIPDGRLILRTEASPSGRLDFTWSYWHDLRFGP